MAYFSPILGDKMAFNISEQPITPEVSIEALRFAGAVEFGSRALGVHTEDSDYDFAILRSNFEQLFGKDIKAFPIKQYFDVVPPNGNNELIPKMWLGDKRVDFLILEHPAHLDMVRRAVAYLKQLGYHSLTDKPYRIARYQKALLHEGFRVRWPVVIANWIRKTF